MKYLRQTYIQPEIQNNGKNTLFSVGVFFGMKKGIFPVAENRKFFATLQKLFLLTF
jgi:hypothetical protein